MWLTIIPEKSVEQIEKDFDRDKWMTATEAKEYGLVDEVLLVNPTEREERSAKQFKKNYKR